MLLTTKTDEKVNSMVISWGTLGIEWEKIIFTIFVRENRFTKQQLDKKYALLEIKDNAGGIDKENIEKVFDPYFTTKYKSQGTGLGLFMSKMIIEKSLEGELSHENVDDGSTFKIKLILG